MKKILLTAIALLTLASASVFGMYGVDGDDWISFLTDGNQFRARMDQLGFVLGNDTIKGTFGFRADTGWMGQILGINQLQNESLALNPTVSAGIGYTSAAFSIGVGYNFTYIDRFLQVHTPVLMLNALDNNLKFVAPIQVAITDNANSSSPDGRPITSNIKFTGVGFNNMELRYATGIDAFNEIRVYASYFNATHETALGKTIQEALGLELRLYFLKTTVGNVGINPFIKVQYSTALKGYSTAEFMVSDYRFLGGIPDNIKQSDIFDVSPYEVVIAPTLALEASSDIVSLYFEPSLGYSMSSYKPRRFAEETSHSLYWGAYAEMYVTPVQDLEWYFEMDVNGDVTGNQGAKTNQNLSPVYFETTTGITWYLPSFGAAE